jgi:hypothetical protein
MSFWVEFVLMDRVCEEVGEPVGVHNDMCCVGHKRTVCDGCTVKLHGGVRRRDLSYWWHDEWDCGSLMGCSGVWKYSTCTAILVGPINHEGEETMTC